MTLPGICAFGLSHRSKSRQICCVRKVDYRIIARAKVAPMTQRPSHFYLQRVDVRGSSRAAPAFSRSVLAIIFVVAGVTHFTASASYLAIMPPYLPWPSQLIVISGLAEILGGLGILWAPTRRSAGWGLIVLLIAVFPANVQVLSTGMIIAGYQVPMWMLWLRLPLQLVLLGWVYRACLRRT